MEEFSRPESEFEAHWLHLYYNYCELTASLGVKLAHNEKYHSLTSYVKHLCKSQISLSPSSLVICISFMMITNKRDKRYSPIFGLFEKKKYTNDSPSHPLKCPKKFFSESPKTQKIGEKREKT